MLCSHAETMAEIVVREAVGADDVAVVRSLMQAYGEYLAANPTGAANMCLQGMRRSWRGCTENMPCSSAGDGGWCGCGLCCALRGLASGGWLRDEAALGGCERFVGMGTGAAVGGGAIQWAQERGIRDDVSRYGSVRLCRRPIGCMQRWGLNRWSDITRIPWSGVEFFRLSSERRGDLVCVILVEGDVVGPGALGGGVVRWG